MSNKKQTSLEWLRQELLKRDMDKSIKELFNQAKEMHREEIEQAYKDGWNAGDFGSDEWAEIYYKELYEH